MMNSICLDEILLKIMCGLFSFVGITVGLLIIGILAYYMCSTAWIAVSNKFRSILKAESMHKKTGKIFELEEDQR